MMMTETDKAGRVVLNWVVQRPAEENRAMWRIFVIGGHAAAPPISGSASSLTQDDPPKLYLVTPVSLWH